VPNEWIIFTYKPERERPGSVRLRWEDNFIIYLKEIISSCLMRLMHPVASCSEHSNECTDIFSASNIAF
jgi:hypothetical protein